MIVQTGLLISIFVLFSVLIYYYKFKNNIAEDKYETDTSYNVTYIDDSSGVGSSNIDYGSSDMDEGSGVGSSDMDEGSGVGSSDIDYGSGDFGGGGDFSGGGDSGGGGDLKYNVNRLLYDCVYRNRYITNL